MLATFPEFTPLHLKLKDQYNDIVSEFPPYSDISFATLQIWWNLSEKLAVSLLNQNLIIKYDLPFDKSSSGLCLVGKNKIEASIDLIFNYLRQNHRKVRLVHVPEFVVEKIKQPDRFTIQEELDYNEYIIDSAALAKLEGRQYKHMRNQVKRFVREVGEHQVKIRELDLSQPAVQAELFAAIYEWELKNTADNDPGHTEHTALKTTMDNSSILGISNIALYIEDKLHGIIIYHQPLQGEYYVLHHLKYGTDIPYVSDYLHQEIAKRAVGRAVSKLNIEMDLGIENLKIHKMKLRPISHFKKYTITPLATKAKTSPHHN